MHTRQIFSVISISVLVATAVVTSCRKSETIMIKPAITIFEPRAGDTVAVAQDSIHVLVSINDSIILQEVAITIKNNSGATLYTSIKAVHDKILFSHTHFKPTGIIATSPMVVTVTATDHNENTASQSVNFFVKP